MSRLGTQHFEHIARIGGFACEARHDEALGDRLMIELETLLGATGAVFYNMSGWSSRPEFGAAHYRNIEADFGALYQEHYHQLDPCLRHIRRDDANPALALSTTAKSVETFSDYENSEYYHEFLRPQSIHSSIIFYLSDNQELLGLFGFQRPKTCDPFDRESELLVRSVAAPIAQALSQRRSVEKAKSRHTVASKIDLTPRQWEVTRFVAEGLSNPEISRQLGVSAKTVLRQIPRKSHLKKHKQRDDKIHG